MLNPEPIQSGPDLNNPECLRAELTELALGLEQQANASRAGSALAGAPYPEHFFRRCALVMNLVAKSGLPKPTEPTPVQPAQPAPQPKPAEKKPAPAPAG